MAFGRAELPGAFGPGIRQGGVSDLCSPEALSAMTSLPEANPPDGDQATPAGPTGDSAATGPTERPASPSPPNAKDTSRVTGESGQTVPSGSGSEGLPETFGHYRIVRKLGQGGMATVYLAEDTILHRQVAVKVPLSEVQRSEAMLARFLREARSAAQLSHPHICQIYEAREIDGRHYIGMEFVDGKPLSAATRGKPVKERQAASLVRKIALAVSAAHAKGLIHRDLKPSNVMLTAKGEPKVTDFGLAKGLTSDAARITHSGAVLGTPAYMPKEQALGDESRIGPASDVYSLGVVLYELLTGRLPFEGPVAAVLGQVMTAEPAPPSTLRNGLDPQLEAICQKAMAKEPEDRYASMGDFASALGDWLKRPAPPAGTQAEFPIDLVFDELPGATVTAKRKRSPPIPRQVLWGGGAALVILLGIVITIISPDGTKTKIEVGVDGKSIEPKSPGKTKPRKKAGSHSGTTKTTPVDIDKAPDRAAALWALSLPHNERYSSVGIEMTDKPGTVIHLHTATDIPSEQFFVRRFDFAQTQGIQPEVLLAYFRRLPQITGLRIDGALLTPELFAEVLKKESFEEFEVWGAGSAIDDNEAQQLARLTNLRSLSLNGCALTDAGLKHVARLTKLSSLQLAGTKITSNGILELRTLDNLSNMLDVSSTFVGDAGIKHLRMLPKLTVLRLSDTPLSDTGLAEIGKLTQLTGLTLDRTRITDDGLKHLADLKRLTSLSVRDTAVTSAAAEKLRESLPVLKFLHYDDTSPPSSKVGASGEKAADGEKDPDRAAALWALSLPLSAKVVPVRINKVGSSVTTDVTDRSQLPTTPFRVKTLFLIFSRDVSSDDLVNHIGPLEDLTSLSVDGKSVTTELIGILGQKSQLQHLDIGGGGGRIRDTELAQLAGLKSLTYLGLSYCEITDAGLPHLREMTDLKDLWITGKSITNQGLLELKTLQSLETLGVQSSSVNDEGLAQLAKFPRLTKLHLANNVGITDAGLKELAKFAKLTNLSLMGTGITDKSIKHLATLKNLTFLELSRTKVTPAAAQKLRESLPMLRTLHVGSGTDAETNASPGTAKPDAATSGKSDAEADPDRAAALWAQSLPTNEKSVARLWIEQPGQTGITQVSAADEVPSGMFRVTRLDLAFSKGASPPVLANHVRRLKYLTQLRVLGDTVTPALIAAIRDKPQLTYLSIIDAGRRIDDDVVSQFADLTKLTHLELTRCDLSDAGLKHLLRMTAMRNLWIGGTRVTNDGIAVLKPLTVLTHIGLNDSLFGDAGIKHLKNFPALTGASLFNDKEITDAGLAELGKLTDVTFLDLSGTGITDAGIEHLAGLKKLRILHVGNTAVTPEAAANLRESLPELQTLTVGADSRPVVNLRGEPDRLKAAIEWVTSIGGRAVPSSNGGLRLMDLPVGVRDADLERISGLSRIAELELHRTRVTDEGLKVIATLPDLQLLKLSGLPISDDGLRHLLPLRKLRSLQLSQTRVSDAGLKTVAGFSDLEELRLASLPITDSGVKSLASLTKLRIVHLDRTEIGSEAIEFLRGRTELEELLIFDTKVDDRGLGMLEECSNLRNLSFSNTSTTDAGLRMLDGLKKLEQLQLSQTAVTQRGLGHLLSHPQLTGIKIDARMLTPYSIDILEKLPKLAVLHVEDAGQSQFDPKALKRLDALPSLVNLVLPRALDDAGAAELEDLTRLEVLTIPDAKITDKGLESIGKLANLRSLWINGANVSPEAVRVLKTTLPQCTIHGP